MAKLRFFPHDPKEIHDDLLRSVEEQLNEPLYPGDERALYTEAMAAVLIQVYAKANDMARQYMLRYARGTVLDALGERVDVTRKEGTPATVTLSFAVGNGLSKNVILPKGTRATPDGTLYFATVSTKVIEAGSLTIEVEAEATTLGESGNGFPPGSISSLVDSIPMVGTVINTTVSGGGDNGEPYTEEGDEHYRERIREASAKLSTAGPYNAYKYFARSAHTGIIDVAVWSPSPGSVTLTPLMEGGEPPGKDVLEAVYTACNAEDRRPLTDLVLVKAPKTVPYDIEFVYYMRATEENEVVQNIEGPGGAIEQYISWQGGTLGRDINPDQLRKTVLAPHWEEGLTGALRMDVKKPFFRELIGEKEADFGKSNQVELAQWTGNLVVSHKVVEE